MFCHGQFRSFLGASLFPPIFRLISNSMFCSSTPEEVPILMRFTSLVFVTSFVHFMTKFPERKEEHIFDALSDPKKANMEDR